MNEQVKKVLKEQLWFVGTCGDEPNVVPVGFKEVLEDGTLAMGDVLMNITLKNILSNGKIAIAVCNAATAESYQIKGTAKYVTEGPVFELFQAMAESTFQGDMNAKGAVIITPEKVIVTSPTAENNKQL